jgi:fluoroquinolone resistance protein
MPSIFTLNQNIFVNESFSDVTPPKEKIINKEFDQCIFEHCNFSEAKFINCKFHECEFKNCNLSLIDISKSSFFDTKFTDTKAIGINWTTANWPQLKLNSPIKFYKCILNHSSFLGLYLKEIAIVECIAREIDLRECDCSEADFTDTDFENSLFNKTNLTKANFSNAINYNINIFNNQLKKTKFSRIEALSLLNSLDIEFVD